jgi:hypothetical protein
MTDTLILTPDPEKLLSAFLRSDPDVAALVADRVYTVFPHDGPGKPPFVRISLIGGPQPPMQVPRWLTSARIQIDTWAKPKAQASLIARTLAAACTARLVGAHTEGVVTAIDIDSEPSYLPDSDLTDPPTPRYLFQLVMTTHPHP